MIDVLSILEQAAVGREWDMNRAAAIGDIDAAKSAQAECESLREVKSAVSQLIDAALSVQRCNDRRKRPLAARNRLRKALAYVGASNEQ